MIRQILRFGLVLAVAVGARAGEPVSAVDNGLSFSIQEAVDFALRANHRYLNLVDQVTASELDYESARSVYKTHFGSSVASDARSGAEVGSTYSLFMDKRNQSGSRYGLGFYNSTFGDNSLSEWRLSYTLPFFRNPLDNDKLAIYQAEIDAARSQRLAEIGQEELTNQVVAAYLHLAMAIRSQELAGEELVIADSFLERQRIRERNGEVSALDLSEAELKRIDARQARDQAILERGAQEDDFRLLLGMDAHRQFSIDPDVLGDVDNPLVDRPLAELETAALGNRPELRAKQEELLMLGRRIESKRAGKLPPVELTLHYALVGEGSGLGDSFSIDDERFGVGFRMDTDLHNTEANVRQRKLALQRRALQREFDYLQRSVISDVRKAYTTAQRARSFLDYLHEYREVAQRRQQQAEILYQRGEVTELELFESNHKLGQAEQRILAARVDYLLAEQSLALAAGFPRY